MPAGLSDLRTSISMKVTNAVSRKTTPPGLLCLYQCYRDECRYLEVTIPYLLIYSNFSLISACLSNAVDVSRVFSVKPIYKSTVVNKTLGCFS